jgi:hypothetical protein
MFSESRYKPLWQLTAKQRMIIKAFAAHQLRLRMVNAGFVNSMDEVLIREVFPGGDGSETDDTKDFEIVGTGIITGQEGWGFDETIVVTVGTPANIIDTTSDNPDGGQVPDRKFICFYGYWDRDVSPSVFSWVFKNGQNVVDIWAPLDECYAKPDKGCGAMTTRPIIYGPKDLMKIYGTWAEKEADKDMGFYALIAEKYGENITRSI